MIGLIPSRWRGPTGTVIKLLIGGLALAASLALDEVVARFVADRPFGYSYDLFTMFRLGGFVPLWGIVAAAFVLIDSRAGWRAAWSRGALLFLAVSFAGVAAEILKLIVRRERPDLDVAGYVFRPWQQDVFSTSGLGWPSSHTAVAFAAAWVLCCLHPRATPVWMLVATACAFSRLARNDHFLSDLVSGALIGYVVVLILWPLVNRLPRA